MRGARTWSLVLVAALALGLVAASCSGSSESARISKLESSVARVSGFTAQVGRKLDTMQTQDQTYDSEISGLKTSLDEIRVALDDIRKDVEAVSGPGSSLQRKIDDVSKKLASLDSRISLLETRYNDHLRKYHSS